jgi:RNA recognition motif-containing protein
MPFSMTEDQLRGLFEEYGQVAEVSVITDRDTGRPRGFAFVEMDDENARQAITALADHEVDGRKLNINEARPRQDRRGGGGGGGRRRGGW